MDQIYDIMRSKGPIYCTIIQILFPQIITVDRFGRSGFGRNNGS